MQEAEKQCRIPSFNPPQHHHEMSEEHCRRVSIWKVFRPRTKAGMSTDIAEDDDHKGTPYEGDVSFWGKE